MDYMILQIVDVKGSCKALAPYFALNLKNSKALRFVETDKFVKINLIFDECDKKSQSLTAF